MVLNLIIFGLIIFLLLVLTMVWPPDSPWAPWWRTNKKTAKEVCRIAKIKKGDVVYDLGCGDGEVLLEAARLGAKGVGIEIDPTRFLIAKMRSLFQGKDKLLKFKRKNFFKENISKADVVVVYLIPKTLEKLLPKFKKELKKGTRIVSFVYDIKGIKPQKINKEYKLKLYTI